VKLGKADSVTNLLGSLKNKMNYFNIYHSKVNVLISICSCFMILFLLMNSVTFAIDVTVGRVGLN